MRLADQRKCWHTTDFFRCTLCVVISALDLLMLLACEENLNKQKKAFKIICHTFNEMRALLIWNCGGISASYSTHLVYSWQLLLWTCSCIYVQLIWIFQYFIIRHGCALFHLGAQHHDPVLKQGSSRERRFSGFIEPRGICSVTFFFLQFFLDLSFNRGTCSLII